MTRSTAEVKDLFEKQNLYPVYQIKNSDPEEYIPYDFIAQHEAQAMKNHGQTLQRLAERGGLGWGEILAIVECRSWGSVRHQDTEKNKEAVMRYVVAYKEGTADG